MGYNTRFSGTIYFAQTISVAEIRELRQWIGGIDVRDIEPNAKYGFCIIDLDIDEDMTGLCWNGSEKTYFLEQQINWVVSKMRLKFPNFTLNGEIEAVVEDGDRYQIVVNAGSATRIQLQSKSERIECPYCGREFQIRMK